MTKQIGIRELKNQASKIVRAVREEAAEYIITIHGEPVAVLRPLTDKDVLQTKDAEIEAELAEMLALADEIAAAWTSDKTGVELVEEQRRY
jgi:prevent-host-death family protein